MIFWFILLYSLIYLSLSDQSKKFQSDAYPKSVPKYQVRIDETTKKPVESGLLHTLPLRSSLVNFRKHLQCATKDPNLNYNNAIISKYRLAPFSSRNVKSICSYIEKRCGDGQCNARIPEYERGDYVKNDENWNAFSGWSRVEMLRVINSTLYNDWPWGVERFDKPCTTNPLGPLLNLTLSRITDMRDSVFWTGGADPGAWHEFAQFPYLSECTHNDYMDTIFPWWNVWIDQLAMYKKMRQQNIPFHEQGYIRYEKFYRHWEQRVSKAALFSTYFPHRVFLLEIARQRPDVIDARMVYHECIRPISPASLEDCDHGYTDNWWPTPEQLAEYNKLPAGYGNGLFNVSTHDYAPYYPAKYKYVVVPLGRQEVLSTSARIVPLLFFSGAVVLMPRTEWKYHFSAQFLPWVHYVPISFTGADLAEKVDWLKEHDAMARQIAENGRNFARSWLRFEDLYCYAANAMDVMASLSENTDAATEYNKPIPLPRMCARQNELDDWYSWPT